MGILEKQCEPVRQSVAAAIAGQHARYLILPMPDFHHLLARADFSAGAAHSTAHVFVHLAGPQTGIMKVIYEAGHLAAIFQAQRIDQGPAQGEIADPLGGPIGTERGAGNTPDLLRISLKKYVEQHLAEPVGDPVGKTHFGTDRKGLGF